MKKFLQDIFGAGGVTESVPREADGPQEIQIATAALLLEIASADDEFTTDERDAIIDIMRERFNLTEQEVKAILNATSKEIEKRIDLYHFTNQINDQFSREEKIEIIEMIWRVVYTDENLDGHEDFLIHRFTRLLRLDHKDMIDAKLKIKKEHGLK